MNRDKEKQDFLCNFIDMAGMVLSFGIPAGIKGALSNLAFVLFMVLIVPTNADAQSAYKEVQPGTIKTVNLGAGVKMDFVWCPPGAFLMGSTDTQQENAIKALPPDLKPGTFKETVKAILKEGPQHKVTFTKGFWMAKTEVTQAQYRQVTGRNPSRFTDAGDNAPVETVSWDECQIFIHKLDRLIEGQMKGKVSLPTEAEWEYACRAGTQTVYYFGDDTSKLIDYAWFAANSSMKTHAVAQKKPNAWGLYDMHGNVWEWCRDFFEKYQAKDVTDPMISLIGQGRVGRGGGWDDFAADLRAAYRSFGRPPSFKASPLGVRPVIKEK